MTKAFSYDDCRVTLIFYRPTTSDDPSGTMTEPTLAKTYNPKSIEANWYERWLDSGHFACAPESTATPYTIMMPPPNVTGSLHMGACIDLYVARFADPLSSYGWSGCIMAAGN